MDGIFIAKNVKHELSRIVNEHDPNLSTDRGDLFLADEVGMAAIRLNISTKDYMKFIDGLPTNIRPKAHQIAPVEEDQFQVVVNAPVTIENGTTLINGKEVTIL